MGAAAIQKKSFSFHSLPSAIKNDVDEFKKGAETARSLAQVLGYLFSASLYFKPLADACHSASSYISATRTLSHIFTWIDRDENGALNALKGAGNATIRVVSLIGYQLSDAVETWNFFGKLKLIDIASISAKMGQIPVLNVLAKVGLGPTKAVFGIIGATAGIVDTGIQIKRTLSSMHENNVVFDLIHGINGRGFLRARNEEDQASIKQQVKATKDLRSGILSIARNILKVSLIILSTVGLALHPIMSFVGLTYGVMGLLSIGVKTHDKQLDPSDPKVIAAWERAKGLPVAA